MNKIKVIAELRDFGTKEFPVHPELNMLGTKYHYVYAFKVGDKQLGEDQETGNFLAVSLGADEPLNKEKEEKELYASLGVLIGSGMLDVPVSQKTKEELMKFAAPPFEADEIAPIVKKEVDLEIRG